MRKSLVRPGFRFKPSDDELVVFYLKNKLLGIKHDPEIIAEININEFKPSDLPAKSILSGDREWYFFCPTSKKYKSGNRTNRATKTGYWKGTGEYKKVIHEGRIVAMRKTLIFYESQGKGTRTNWVMHEYRMTDDDLAKEGVSTDAYVVCRVFEKNDIGPNNGAQYGAPFKEKDWNDKNNGDDDDGSNVTSIMMVGVLVNTKDVSGSSVMNMTSSEAGPSIVTSSTMFGMSGAIKMLDPNSRSSGPSTLIDQDNERLTHVPVNNNAQEVENHKRKKVEVEDRRGKKVMTDPVNEIDIPINDGVMLTNADDTQMYNPNNVNINSTLTSSALVGLSGVTNMIDPNASSSGPSTLIHLENQTLIDIPGHDDVMLSHGERALLLQNDNTMELEVEDRAGKKMMTDDCFDIFEELEAVNKGMFNLEELSKFF